MIKRTRYLLLFLGVVVFAILAPLTVLYVRGFAFDFKTKTFVATGILAVRSEPQNADIFLNGKLAKKGGGDIRFLTPGEYQVDLKKEGYNNWSKRLAVLPGQVTWTAPAFKNIYLFLKNPEILGLQEGVFDVYSNGSTVVYLTGGGASVASINDLDKPRTYALPEQINKILAADAAGKNFALGQLNGPAVVIFNSDSGQLSDISQLFDFRPEIKFGQNGNIFAESNGILYKIDVKTKTKTALFKKITAFYLLNDSLYFIQEPSVAETQAYSLLVSQSPFKNSQLLLGGLPKLDVPDLFVTFEKQVFILSGGNLYLAGSDLQKLAENVSTVPESRQNSPFAILHAGQLDYYDPLGQNLSFITRLSETISNPVISNGVDGAFFIKNNRLNEIELDTRGNQNQYVLYQGTDIQKFYVDSVGKNVLILDGGALKSLIIR